MSLFRRGRRRHGPQRKESHSVSLMPEVAERLAELGTDSTTGKQNLSAGITIAEHMTRGMLPPALQAGRLKIDMRLRRPRETWIVFELVDGPADPPRAGENFDAWRDAP